MKATLSLIIVIFFLGCTLTPSEVSNLNINYTTSKYTVTWTEPYHFDLKSIKINYKTGGINGLSGSNTIDKGINRFEVSRVDSILYAEFTVYTIYLDGRMSSGTGVVLIE